MQIINDTSWKRIVERRLIDSAFVVLTAPGLVFPSENVIRSMLYPLGRTVPKLKHVSFDFHKVSWFLTSIIFTSIPIDIESSRLHILCSLFINNRPLKQ